LKLLNNRHFRIALFVSPVLAILSYFAVDRVVSEDPNAAVAGQSYPLAAKANCRYPSGVCGLENGDVKLLVRAKRLSSAEVELSLSSELPITSALVSFGSGDDFSLPVAFFGRRDLTVRLNLSDPQQDILRWAVTISGATYFAETPALFVDNKTGFSQDNFAVKPE
jgi:hypothetical protein